MRVTTLAVYDSTGALVHWEGYEYEGPVAECKKGREVVDQAGKNSLATSGVATDVAKQARGIADKDQALQTGYRDKSDAAANDLLTVPQNGGLNPALARAFEQEKTQIGRAYNDTAGAAMRGIAARGMGVAPSGIEASIRNTAGRNADEAETTAYGDLLSKQLGLGVQGIERGDQQQQTYDPNKPLATTVSGLNASTNANEAATSAGEKRGKMGSKLGDIFSGISRVAGTVGALV